MIVRKATLSDASAIATINAETFIHTFAFSMPAEDVETYTTTVTTPAAYTEAISNEAENVFFVAVFADHQNPTKNGQVAGFIQMKMGTTEPCVPTDIPTCELHRIYCSKDSTGLGVGRLLIERGLKWAQEYVDGKKAKSGAGETAAVWLGVWEEHPYAKKFYERAGFRKVGSHDFVMGATTQTDEIFLKWL